MTRQTMEVRAINDFDSMKSKIRRWNISGRGSKTAKNKKSLFMAKDLGQIGSRGARQDLPTPKTDDLVRATDRESVLEATNNNIIKQRQLTQRTEISKLKHKSFTTKFTALERTC